MQRIPKATPMTPAVATLVLSALVLAGCSPSDEGFSLDKFAKSLIPASPSEVLDDSMLSPSADKRREALYKMSKWKNVDESYVGLVGLAILGEKDTMTRAQAARTLGAWGKPYGTAYLSVALAGKIEGVEFPETVEYLSRLGVALPTVADRSKLVRRNAAAGLAMMKTDEAVKSLVHGLRYDSDVDVRLQCARSLSRHRHTEAAPGLLLGLIDSDLAVRVAAAESLQYMTGQNLGQDVKAWEAFLAKSESPLAQYGHKVRVKRNKALWFDLSQERKAKIMEIFSDLFPLERKEGPFD